MNVQNERITFQKDYYPYGMIMPGRKFNGENYRFGFGNHENDVEMQGFGNLVNMGDRQLDTRIARTFTPDVLAKNYPDISPYSFAANSPLLFMDSDGKEVKAYSKDAQELVLKTLNYAFGEKHGFSFVNNTLIHNSVIPENMTSQQAIIFRYINDALIKSHTITTVKTNESISVRRDINGKLQDGGVVKENGATTFYYPEMKTIKDNGPFNAPTILDFTEAENEILLSSGLQKNGINLETEVGDKTFGSDAGLLHEFAHAIENVIMNEFNGQFNGVDFAKMTKQERADWSIQFTNTLLQSKNEPLETGKGQHGRKADEKPASPPQPLTK
jgi:hypothetical protein